jgi:hypothetical protein
MGKWPSFLKYLILKNETLLINFDTFCLYVFDCSMVQIQIMWIPKRDTLHSTSQCCTLLLLTIPLLIACRCVSDFLLQRGRIPTQKTRTETQFGHTFHPNTNSNLRGTLLSEMFYQIFQDFKECVVIHVDMMHAFTIHSFLSFHLFHFHYKSHFFSDHL